MEIKTEKMLTAETRKQMLTRIMDHYNIASQAEFGRRMGISAQNVNSWFARGTFNEELVALSFPELSGDWLLTGEEPMLKADRVAPRQPETNPTDADFRRAIFAIAEEQKLTAKAQAQADKLLTIMLSLASSLKRLQRGSE